MNEELLIDNTQFVKAVKDLAHSGAIFTDILANVISIAYTLGMKNGRDTALDLVTDAIEGISARQSHQLRDVHDEIDHDIDQARRITRDEVLFIVDNIDEDGGLVG